MRAHPYIDLITVREQACTKRAATYVFWLCEDCKCLCSLLKCSHRLGGLLIYYGILLMTPEISQYRREKSCDGGGIVHHQYPLLSIFLTLYYPSTSTIIHLYHTLLSIYIYYYPSLSHFIIHLHLLLSILITLYPSTSTIIYFYHTFMKNRIFFSFRTGK